MLIIATDVDGVYRDWGTPDQRLLAWSHPEAIDPADFAPGSMGPKVKAARLFAESDHGDAVIGSLSSIAGLFAGTAGTLVSLDVDGVAYRDEKEEIVGEDADLG